MPPVGFPWPRVRIGLSAFFVRDNALIPLDQRFHVPRSLKRQLRPGRF